MTGFIHKERQKAFKRNPFFLLFPLVVIYITHLVIFQVTKLLILWQLNLHAVVFLRYYNIYSAFSLARGLDLQ